MAVHLVQPLATRARHVHSGSYSPSSSLRLPSFHASEPLKQRRIHMKALLRLFTALLLLWSSSCSVEEVDSKPSFDYQVYSDVLRELKWFSNQKNVLVIRQKTTCRHFLDYDAKARSHIKKSFGSALDDSLFEGFRRINAKPIILEAQFEDSLSIVLLSKEEEDNVFNPSDSGWKRFYAKYPKSCGFIELSRVAFASSKTKALLYCGTTGDRGKGGIGYYILLKKQDSKWMIEKKVMAWVR
jgi:hypothetical protein